MGACKECGCKDGDRGPIGIAGEKGETGSSGLQGNPGPQGIPGPQGDQGIQGFQGIQGDQGPPGSSVDGDQGPTGPQGDTGPQGNDGPAGLDGTNGTNGANGKGRLNYVINSVISFTTLLAVLNEGIIMKNTGFSVIQLPTGAQIGDVVRVVGTHLGTGGWRLKALGTDTIQMTSQNPVNNITLPAGYVEPATTNYRDVITVISDGGGNWIIIDAMLANGNLPLFN
jgi:hypothetical protein